MKYDPKLCVEIFKEMASGKSDTKVMALWGISRDTFYRWKKEYPDFAEAHSRGKVQFDAAHEQIGEEGMLKTRDVDYQFWRDLGKYRNGWKDNPASGNTTNTQINVNILQQQTDEELIEFIKNKLEQVPELSHIIDVTPD